LAQIGEAGTHGRRQNKRSYSGVQGSAAQQCGRRPLQRVFSGLQEATHHAS
jgi:hypothetical protein